mmetsp:Transcript_10844/g.19280  ORF Transcript_10844/g.19280 Transcript_10844/m.19280 type:complete len:289 (-) Transcript_10844:71-937(-)
MAASLRAKESSKTPEQVWWSFELQALVARFGSAVTRYVGGGSGAGPLLEVDLSHFIGQRKGAILAVTILPTDYPRSRPLMNVVDRCGSLDREVLKELSKHMMTSFESAAAANGPGIFFAVDEVAGLLRRKFPGQGFGTLRPPRPVLSGDIEKHSEAVEAQVQYQETVEETVKSKRRRRRKAAGPVLPLMEKKVCDSQHMYIHQSPVPVEAGRASLSTGVSTPSNISDMSNLTSSSSSEDSLDSSSSSDSSDGDGCDDEMASIAAQLHVNVRRQLLFKRGPRPAGGLAS